MGDTDEHQGGDTTTRNSEHQNTIDRTLTDLTETPLTDEEYAMLEKRLRDGGGLGTNNSR